MVSQQWILLSVILLFVAAEPYELAPLLQQCRWVRPTGFGHSADWREHRVLAAACGPGPELVVEAMTQAMTSVRPDAVISAGVCGALDPALRIGEIFVAGDVMFRGRRYSCAQPRTTRRHAGGVLSSQDRVVVTAQEKQALARTGCSAVDMESGAIAARAAQDGLPFYSVRAVSDLAGESFPIDFNEMRDPAGRFSRIKIIRAALADPFGRAAALWRIRHNTRLAAHALGDFLADCGF